MASPSTKIFIGPVPVFEVEETKAIIRVVFPELEDKDFSFIDRLKILVICFQHPMTLREFFQEAGYEIGKDGTL